jgi:hypothetical protein
MSPRYDIPAGRAGHVDGGGAPRDDEDPARPRLQVVVQQRRTVDARPMSVIE